MSSHTIRNDIRVLELEYPIYTRMGAGGGVFILDSSRLQQRWLTVRQRELLMDVCSVLDDEQALLMRIHHWRVIALNYEWRVNN